MISNKQFYINYIILFISVVAFYYILIEYNYYNVYIDILIRTIALLSFCLYCFIFQKRIRKIK